MPGEDVKWIQSDIEATVMIRTAYPIYAVQADGSYVIVAYATKWPVGLHIATIHNQQIEARLTHGNKESSKEASA